MTSLVAYAQVLNGSKLTLHGVDGRDVVFQQFNHWGESWVYGLRSSVGGDKRHETGVVYYRLKIAEGEILGWERMTEEISTEASRRVVSLRRV